MHPVRRQWPGAERAVRRQTPVLSTRAPLRAGECRKSGGEPLLLAAGGAVPQHPRVLRAGDLRVRSAGPQTLLRRGRRQLHRRRGLLRRIVLRRHLQRQLPAGLGARSENLRLRPRHLPQPLSLSAGLAARGRSFVQLHLHPIAVHVRTDLGWQRPDLLSDRHEGLRRGNHSAMRPVRSRLPPTVRRARLRAQLSRGHAMLRHCLHGAGRPLLQVERLVRSAFPDLLPQQRRLLSGRHAVLFERLLLARAA